MRNFEDTEMAQAFDAAMPPVPADVLEQGYAVDYGWVSVGDHLVIYRRTSQVETGNATIDFLGYMLEDYYSPTMDTGDEDVKRTKYKVTRDDALEGAYHDPNEGAPLTRALPSAHGAIRTNGCMTFALYETHACRYDEMEDALALIKNARDWAEDFAEIER